MDSLMIHAASSTYPVLFDDFLHNPKARIHSSSKALIISNPMISGLYLHQVLPKISAQEVFVCIVPDGEEHKHMETINQILHCAFSHRLDRQSLMIALGGGVITDMVGFASGIFERGIAYVSIPTTLLAQVDASVGGKCGVNNAFGKNLIGLFHQPRAVYIDSAFLQSLSMREKCSGFVEMIKIFICFDGHMFMRLEEIDDIQAFLQDSARLLPYIRRAVELKADVVARDERESGIRAALNYGHTFGHVIEAQTHYKQFLHGEAIAIGMRMANALAQRLGMLKEAESKRINALLDAFMLHYTYKIPHVEDFYQALFLDKKARNNTLHFVLPKGIGDFSLHEASTKDDVIHVLNMFAKSR